MSGTPSPFRSCSVGDEIVIRLPVTGGNNGAKVGSLVCFDSVQPSRNRVAAEVTRIVVRFLIRPMKRTGPRPDANAPRVGGPVIHETSGRLLVPSLPPGVDHDHTACTAQAIDRGGGDILQDVYLPDVFMGETREGDS